MEELTLDEVIEKLTLLRARIGGNSPIGVRMPDTDGRHAQAAVVTAVTADVDKSGTLVVIEHL